MPQKICEVCGKPFFKRFPYELRTQRFCDSVCGGIGRRRRMTQERFWERVNKGSPDECWNWTGTKTSFGYGCTYGDGTLILAHRYSWVIHNGDILEDMFVLHHCDNPACVNPRHLYLGTQKDNMADRSRRRRCCGTVVGTAKLNEKDIDTIDLMLVVGILMKDIATMFGVSEDTIYSIKYRHTWKHVPRHKALSSRIREKQHRSDRDDGA